MKANRKARGFPRGERGNHMAIQYIKEELSTPVRFTCDVLVAGGGTAGTIAAIAAARNGASVILVERNSYLGGTLLDGAGPLHSYFNLYKAFPEAGKIQVVRGIASELVERMQAVGGSYGHLEQEMGYSYDSVATIIDREMYKEVIFDMMEEAGVKLLLHTDVAAVIKNGDAVQGVIIESKSGREAILAKSVIDCTGDGDVAARAGVPFKKCHETTSVGFPFGMANVDLKRMEAFLEEKGIIYQIIHADKGVPGDDLVRIGFQLREMEEFRPFMEETGMWGPLTVARHPGELSYINTANLRAVDGTDVEALTEAEIKLRKQAMTMARMLKKYIPGFEHAYVSWTINGVGVRYTRCIECEHDLSIDEILNGQRFEDEIGLYGFHDSAPRMMIRDGKYYGIPYRCLLPREVEGLLVAGRMITSDWDAHMSTRNTVSCMVQGQAAGTAAALAAADGTTVRAVDVPKLQKTLREQGVFLG